MSSVDLLDRPNGKSKTPKETTCTVPECPYSDRVSAVEERLGKIEQLLREQSEMMASIGDSLAHRNVAIDRLTSMLVLGDDGLAVNKTRGT
jgi:hypothetical protein